MLQKRYHVLSFFKPKWKSLTWGLFYKVACTSVEWMQNVDISVNCLIGVGIAALLLSEELKSASFLCCRWHRHRRRDGWRQMHRFSVTLLCGTYATEGSGISFLKCQSPLSNIESEEHNKGWWKHNKHLRIRSIWFWWASKNNNTKKLSVVLLGVMILTVGFHHPENWENRRSWSQIVEVEWLAKDRENAENGRTEREQLSNGQAGCYRDVCTQEKTWLIAVWPKGRETLNPALPLTISLPRWIPQDGWLPIADKTRGLAEWRLTEIISGQIGRETKNRYGVDRRWSISTAESASAEISDGPKLISEMT